MTVSAVQSSPPLVAFLMRPESYPECPRGVERIETHISWVNERNMERTFSFLRENNLPYVCVDEPQGFQSSVPPVVAATSDISLVRFHGRNKENWEKPGITAAERFNYLYSEEELQEWAPAMKNLASQTRQLHVLFNNCHHDKAVVNARQIRLMLD